MVIRLCTVVNIDLFILIQFFVVKCSFVNKTLVYLASIWKQTNREGALSSPRSTDQSLKRLTFAPRLPIVREKVIFHTYRWELQPQNTTPFTTFEIKKKKESFFFIERKSIFNKLLHIFDLSTFIINSLITITIGYFKKLKM